MKKVAVFGSKGMLGITVSNYFIEKDWEVINISRNEFDIYNYNHSRIRNLISDGEYVINCAGVIKQRGNAISDEEMLKVNGLFPRNLAMIGNELNKKVINISTDCAYDGKKGDYNEKDIFNANDLYGMSKISGESNLCMNLRTSIVGEENYNKHSLFEWARSNKGNKVKGFTNHLWNGLTTVYLAEIIEKIFTKNIYQNGIFHIHSPNIVNKFELLEIFNEVYNLDLIISPVETEVGVDRSLSSIYNLSSELVTKQIKEQVYEMKRFFNKKIIQCQ
ncbi:MAG: SDR family oxidoreductase [Ignavibacteriae bacterium]|nr:SDR family oxidoreductase [Ignavibacteriota bacterium]